MTTYVRTVSSINFKLFFGSSYIFKINIFTSSQKLSLKLKSMLAMCTRKVKFFLGKTHISRQSFLETSCACINSVSTTVAKKLCFLSTYNIFKCLLINQNNAPVNNVYCLLVLHIDHNTVSSCFRLYEQ